MKRTLSIILFLAVLLPACNTDSASSEESTATLNELGDANAIIDSLRQKIAALEEKNLTLVGSKNSKEAPVLSREEAAVQKMVINLRGAFNTLHQDKDPDKILQYFLPAFSTNQVTIDVNNEAEIALFTADDFKSFLKKQMREKGMSTEVGKITFLDTQIKGEIFTTTFKNSANVFKNNALISNRSIISTITGRNQNGWKIGNYSWVSIDYPPAK
jgi:hypothetical protein